MKRRRASDEEINLMLSIIGEPVPRLFAGPGVVVLDLGQSHIVVGPAFDTAATQNETGDEAIYATASLLEGHYEPDPCENLVARSQILRKVEIVDTVLFFTDQVTFSPDQRRTARLEAAERARSMKRIGHGRQSATRRISAVLEGAMADAVGGHDEVLCDPRLPGWKTIDEAFTNHLDVGFVFTFDDGLLPAFSIWNSSILAVPDDGELVSREELLELIEGSYRLTAIGERSRLG